MIELVVVIVILGILSATALPRFIDLRAESQAVVFDSTVAAIQTADRMNALAWKASGGTKGIKTAGRDCADVIANFLNGALPAGYRAAGGVIPAAGALPDNLKNETPLGPQYGCEIDNNDSDATTPVTITE